MRQRLSFSAIAVLRALADGRRHGFDIIGATGLGAATVYPTLGKLEDAGFVTSTWEDPAIAHREKRPARRYCTRSGQTAGARSPTPSTGCAYLQGDTAPAKPRRAEH